MPGGRVKVVNSGSIRTQVYQRPLVVEKERINFA
jgi:hypothetical protein